MPLSLLCCVVDWEHTEFKSKGRQTPSDPNTQTPSGQQQLKKQHEFASYGKLFFFFCTASEHEAVCSDDMTKTQREGEGNREKNRDNDLHFQLENKQDEDHIIIQFAHHSQLCV